MKFEAFQKHHKSKKYEEIYFDFFKSSKAMSTNFLFFDVAPLMEVPRCWSKPCIEQTWPSPLDL